MSEYRNKLGFKDSIHCYRTVNGQRYIAWLFYPSPGRAKRYRDNGVMCRRFKDELYIREDDEERALELDRKDGI